MKSFILCLVLILGGYANAQSYTSSHTGNEIDSVVSGDFGTKNIITAGNFLGQKLIGGTGTTSDLYLQTTSGVGTTGADMHLLVGNNGGTEAMTILNDGKVGIGTTLPLYTLDINGSIRIGDGIVTPGFGELFFASKNQNTATIFTVENDHTGTGAFTEIAVSGKDGALHAYRFGNNYSGVTKYQKLSALLETDAILTNGFGISSTGGPFKVYTGGDNTRLTVISTGSIGVGTTAPDKQLEINSTTGAGLRLTYNDANGSAANYTDFSVSSAGDLNILPSGTDMSISGTINYFTDAQASDTYVVTLNGTIAYVTGLEITFKANTANTDGATINVNGLGAKALTKASLGAINTALATGDILAGQIVKAIYDGTQFQVISRLAQ